MSEFVVTDGMPLSVFLNKYARPKPEGGFESYAERITEAVLGNWDLLRGKHQTRWRFGIHPEVVDGREERHVVEGSELEELLSLARRGVVPLSGRHLQQGDRSQPGRMLEVFTNCSTAMFSFVKFWLLLKGSGVGRCYDSDLCRVDWDHIPRARFVIDEAHPDWHSGLGIETLGQARHKYDSESESVRWFEVEDSVEGWVKVVEVLETAAYQKKHADKLFIFDFSKVRPAGAPIRGQQGRPSSGPIPLIRALHEVSTVKGAGMKPWKQALYVDHYLSACVVVGGVRRSSRIAVKSWRDRDVIEFIDIKRTLSPSAVLYTANNSVAVDREFWEKARDPRPSHARRVFEAAVGAAYWDKTGEPGFLNVDQLTGIRRGVDSIITRESYFSPRDRELLRPHRRTFDMLEETLHYAKAKEYPWITNPCGEIVLASWGGYCVIADVCLANAQTPEEAMRACELAARFLVRCNLMDSLYEAEVRRTNRIGVSLTGIHEFAWRHFGLTFRNMLNPDEAQANDFWAWVVRARNAAEHGARQQARDLGLVEPHTVTTIKPSGTISKVMACTEGAHLPSAAHYVRWVKFPIGAPEVAAFRSRGYPVKDVSAQYAGYAVVGFPTRLPVADLMGKEVVTASEATVEEQFRWLHLLQEHWLGEGRNNQVSYTLKYDPDAVDFLDYQGLVLEHQPRVKACSVSPVLTGGSYAYLPEEPISEERYRELVSGIERTVLEGYDPAHLDCGEGGCPIEPDQVR